MGALPGAERRSFLFVLWEGGGNVPPQLAIARRLAARGHGVRVMGDESLRGDAAAAGARFVSFTRAPSRPDRTPESDPVRDYEARTPVGAFARVRDRVMAGPALAYAEDVREELSREAADAVVVDFLVLGAAVGAEAAGAPVAILCHTPYLLPRPGVPAPGPGLRPMRGPLGGLRDALVSRAFLRLFASALPALNRARGALGLPPLRALREHFDGAARVLVLTSPALDFGAQGLPPNTSYVGPQLDDPAWAGAWEDPWPAGDDRPLVVVSLSTTPQGQAALLQRVVDSLAELPVRGLVTTGPAVEPERLRLPANVVALRSAPHARVFPRAAVVVTHAGHGTVVRALAAGVPLVCLPMGRDQPDVAARVVHAGAGVRLPPRARVRAIRRAVRRVLEEPAYRRAAGRMAREVAADVRRDLAVEELESLARG